MLTHSDNSSVADVYFRTLKTDCNEHSLQWQGAITLLPDERPLFTACHPVEEAGYRLANDGQWVSRHSLDSGPVNEPLRQGDAIDNTAGQGLSSLHSIRFSGPATQAMVDRFSSG